MVNRTEGNIDDSLIGGNASAEGPEGEDTASTVIVGVGIIRNNRLQETASQSLQKVHQRLHEVNQRET